MKSSYLLITAALALPTLAQAKTIQEWEKCANKIGSTLNIVETGNAGFEQEIKRQCGVRPATTIPASQLQGRLAFDAFQAAPWKDKFMQLTQKDYAEIQAALTVSTPLQQNGDWVVGEGYNPQAGGSGKAIIAINIKTAKVLVGHIDIHSAVRTYGFDSNSKTLPASLKKWFTEATQAAG